MKIYDISMPVTDAWEPHHPEYYPRVEIEHVLRPDDPESLGRVSRKISCLLHTGTHVDYREHMGVIGDTLDQVPFEQYVGRATLLDFRSRVAERVIDVEHVQAAAEGQTLQDRVVIGATGWGDRYGADDYFTASPYMTIEAAQWIADQRPRMYGNDFLSTDYEGDMRDFPKRILMSNGAVFLSNLVNLSTLLDEAGDQAVTVMAFPINIKGVEAAMARAIAIVGDDVTALLTA